MQVRDLIAELQRFNQFAEVKIEFLPDTVPAFEELAVIEKVRMESGEPVLVCVEE